MPRSLWAGSVSFGLVNVPVQLVSAARDLDVHFHELHEKDGARLERRRVCAKEGVEVDWEEIAHAYDRDDGTTVVLTDEELAAAAPRRTRTIEVEAFVDLADVDPVYFDHPYLLLPSGESEGVRRAYRLLVETMRRSERAALGRFVLRTKEHLAAIRAREDVLALTTMRFHDEVRPAKDVPTGGRRPAKAAVQDAVAIIEELTVAWDPQRHEDCYRERLHRVIDAKRQGRTVKPPARRREPAPAPDLMEALAASLAQARAGIDGGGEADLADLTKVDLLERARAEDISGRSKMTKDELVEALGG